MGAGGPGGDDSPHLHEQFLYKVTEVDTESKRFDGRPESLLLASHLSSRDLGSWVLDSSVDENPSIATVATLRDVAVRGATTRWLTQMRSLGGQGRRGG